MPPAPRRSLARDLPPAPDWDGVRLHVVTGKGGTGKTTVASALAIALATGGKKVLLAEVEGRQGLAALFDRPELPYAERHLASAPDGGEVIGLAVEPKAALLEYLDLFYKLGRAGKVLERLGAIDFATTIAPGLRDVLLTGKVYEAARRRVKNAKGDPAGQRKVYDAIVLDAPPTGRITNFLNVNEEVADLAKVGPIRAQADSIMTLLRSPQTVVHVVTLLEEMPVQETADAVADLRRVDLRVGGIVVNLERAPLLRKRPLGQAARGRLDRAAVAEGLAAAGLGRRGGTVDAEVTDRLLTGLLDEAADHARRVAVEDQQRAAVAELARPTYTLPALDQGVDLGALYVLARALREQGMA